MIRRGKKRKQKEKEIHNEILETFYECERRYSEEIENGNYKANPHSIIYEVLKRRRARDKDSRDGTASTTTSNRQLLPEFRGQEDFQVGVTSSVDGNSERSRGSEERDKRPKGNRNTNFFSKFRRR
jgi:hypothetical protein